MNRSVKWQEDSSAISEASDSPSLSDRKPLPLKRKKSSIFSKLRKSILGTVVSSKDNEEGKGTQSIELKRTLSMDAGLLNRISQLNMNAPTDSIDNLDENRAGLRRSKSLVNPVELKFSSSNGIGSILNSPITDEPIFLSEDHHTIEATSLINTIETNHLHLNQQVFECSWLAPTGKFQIFPGHLSLQPKSLSIIFNCEHISRRIRIKFHFDDILNISRGSWNDKRDQALIIDLIRGKRKTWVFVAWTEDTFTCAIDCLVNTWRLHCFNKIKSKIDRRQAYLNIKYFRIIKEADRAASNFIFPNGFLQNLKDFFTHHNDSHSLFQKLAPASDIPEPVELENDLVEMNISSIVPDILASILMEKTTSFMTNFRALQRLEISNDSSWNNKSNSWTNQTQTRNFVSIVKSDQDGIRFKWNVSQKLIFYSPEMVIFQSNLQSPNDESFDILYKISALPQEEFNTEPACRIKITSNVHSERVKSFLKDEYFPTLFNLLEAFIYKSFCEFSEQQSEHDNSRIILPPHYRFVKESIKTTVLKINLYFTTALLPFLYKLIHYKEFKLARYSILALVVLVSFRFGLDFTIDLIREFTKFKYTEIEEEFDSLIGDIASDSFDSSIEIKTLRLKYNLKAN